jgi:hypothetical protein
MAAIHQISSDFAPIYPATLTPIQAQVVAALAKGQTITAAAREAGIHRTTIHHWHRTEPAFKTAVEGAQSEYVAALNDEMRELSASALSTLRSLLADPAAPPAIRLRAALAVLQRPKFPDQGWSLPARIEALEKPATKPEAEPSGPQNPPSTTPHLPYRSAPCPCGSGLKYKRCCAGHPIPTTHNPPPALKLFAAPPPAPQPPCR